MLTTFQQGQTPSKCQRATQDVDHGAVARFLVHSYLYYVLNDSIISDPEFDKLSRYLLQNWSKIEHPHKRFITEVDLQAGTGFRAVTGKRLPTVVRVVATRLASDEKMRAEFTAVDREKMAGWV
jgi:NAD-dependent DNA ligase